MDPTGPSLLRGIERWNLLFGLVLVAGAALLFRTAAVVAGVGLGAALASVNFHILRRLVERVSSARSKGLLVFVLLTKMIALLATVWLILALLPVNAIAFTVGLSVFLVSILASAIKLAIAQAEADGTLPEPGVRGQET
jgi:hypothetical protein